jgi:hypothetical protein
MLAVPTGSCAAALDSQTVGKMRSETRETFVRVKRRCMAMDRVGRTERFPLIIAAFLHPSTVS